MNKKWLKGALYTSLSLCALSAHAGLDFDNLAPYVGADAQWRRMPYEKGYGGNVLPKDFPQGNIYLGLKFNEFFGFEAGYQTTKKVKNTSNLAGRDTFLGDVLEEAAPNDTFKFNTNSKASAFHGSIVGFFPISETYCLDLIGSLGIARAQVRSVIQLVSIDNAPLNSPAVIFKKNKWVPKVGLGLQHMLLPQLGIRAMGSFEKTKMDIKSASGATTAKLKNSFTLGLGVFFKFK